MFPSHDTVGLGILTALNIDVTAISVYTGVALNILGYYLKRFYVYKWGEPQL